MGLGPMLMLFSFKLSIIVSFESLTPMEALIVSKLNKALKYENRNLLPGSC